MASGDSYFVVAPASTVNSTSGTTPSNAIVAYAAPNSKNYNTLMSGGSVTIKGTQYYRYSGPFATKTEAASFQPSTGINALLAELGAAVSAGSSGAAAKEAAAFSQGETNGSGTCLITVPVLGGCLFTKTNARALIAGLMLAGFTIVGIIGLCLIVVEGFEKSGAGKAAGSALETIGAGVAFIPGAEGAGIAVGSAGSAARRVSSSGASQSLARRRQAREAAQQQPQDQDPA